MEPSSNDHIHSLLISKAGMTFVVVMHSTNPTWLYFHVFPIESFVGRLVDWALSSTRDRLAHPLSAQERARCLLLTWMRKPLFEIPPPELRKEESSFLPPLPSSSSPSSMLCAAAAQDQFALKCIGKSLVLVSWRARYSLGFLAPSLTSVAATMLWREFVKRVSRNVRYGSGFCVHSFPISAIVFTSSHGENF